jgi:UDP-N-acetylmuramate dehydrogenase
MKRKTQEKILGGIEKNISLKNFTTFKIGGKAKYFFIAKKKENLIEAVLWAAENGLTFFILGGGSNLLVSDKGFKGLVIKNESKNYKIEKGKIFAESGVSLSVLVNEAVKNNLAGLEWAAGIPGTVGGAIFGNAGAFGESVCDNLMEVEVFDVKDKKIKILENKDCKFSYRNSIFKKNKNLVIISVSLSFKKGDLKMIKEKIKKFLECRRESQPLNFPSAGSVFVNPGKKSAGDLIERCGLKGRKAGDAKISEKHANFVVNLRGASSKDVEKLINLAKKSAKNKFGVDLEEEIQCLP